MRHSWVRTNADLCLNNYKTGSLHFANVEEADDLDSKDYVCIVQNEKLRGLVQGDDQRVFPVAEGRIPHINTHSQQSQVFTNITPKSTVLMFKGLPSSLSLLTFHTFSQFII